MSPLKQDPPILVRRYAGSRLYDAAAGRYLTVEGRVVFEVRDNRSGEDLTHELLAS